MTPIIKKIEKEAYYYGLKPYEFWKMTFSEYKLYMEQKGQSFIDEIERQDYRLATLMAFMYNLNKGKKGKPKKAEDFIKRKVKKNKPMSSKMMVEVLKAFTLANGGTVKM